MFNITDCINSYHPGPLRYIQITVYFIQPDWWMEYKNAHRQSVIYLFIYLVLLT